MCSFQFQTISVSCSSSRPAFFTFRADKVSEVPGQRFVVPVLILRVCVCLFSVSSVAAASSAASGASDGKHQAQLVVRHASALLHKDLPYGFSVFVDFMLKENYESLFLFFFAQSVCKQRYASRQSTGGVLAQPRQAAFNAVL